ncbi:MAG: hypothetical protein A2622_12490 [Bdellovibrionales bacterium RIFCSPHIGHO2_01_FULL_40_29]|nr:MAG: hypothetical protein A2622_12490 [Bdellovibrionales bacterium RIFCSPHIGHO2_01_FULL_40_29]OFZ33002.1 MAG: hypothetical protein A3D17_09800 [Bdellovibrionales bacterium RIFCSPHIGHO2_02_FULL_40_15]
MDMLISSQMRKLGTLSILAMSALIIFTSCSPGYYKSIDQASTDISNSLGCNNVQSKVFDAFYSLIDQEQIIPDANDLKSALDKKIDEIENKVDSVAQQKQVSALRIDLHQLVDLMLEESLSNPNITWKEQIQKLIEYEMEDRTEAQTVVTSQKISLKVESIKKAATELSLGCEATPSPAPMPNPTPTPVPRPGDQAQIIPMSKGIDRVFSTAYQSCRVLDLPEMDRSTSSVVGIERVGTHSDGIGGKRVISNLASVQNTHYYIRGIASESQCKEVRETPLIYDYGGSPAISGNAINFFANAGSGTEVLGVDCSAYVSSAIAVAGLRYKPSLENKPIYIRQNSAKFIDAELSGFSCFENISVSKTHSIQPGDIVGVKGHVVAVDRIGADPFGLGLLSSVEQCGSLNYKNFDIGVTQSSPSKNGIGINKYVIKDYLDETSKMRTAFVEMGKQSCLAYFLNKSIKPKSTEWGFLRHKGTTECMAPRVTLAGESCTQKCF